MCYNLDWCYPDYPNGDPTVDIESYIDAVHKTLQYWLDIHINRDAWAHECIVDDPTYSFESNKGILQNDYFYFDWEQACYEIMARDYEQLCCECYEEKSYCSCDDPEYFEVDAYYFRDMSIDIPEEIMIDALASKGFDTYRDALQSLTAPIEDEIEDLLEQYEQCKNKADLLSWAVWANHVQHVNGNVISDYGHSFGIDYKMVDSCSNGLDSHFGQDEIDFYLEDDKNVVIRTL